MNPTDDHQYFYHFNSAVIFENIDFSSAEWQFKYSRKSGFPHTFVSLPFLGSTKDSYWQGEKDFSFLKDELSIALHKQVSFTYTGLLANSRQQYRDPTSNYFCCLWATVQRKV